MLVTPATLGVILTIVVMMAAMLGLYVATRGRSAKETLDLLPQINEELREQIKFYQAEGDRKEREHSTEMRKQEDRFNDKLHKQELRCSQEISELRGQVNALTGNMAVDIAEKVVVEIKKEMGK